MRARLRSYEKNWRGWRELAAGSPGVCCEPWTLEVQLPSTGKRNDGVRAEKQPFSARNPIPWPLLTASHLSVLLVGCLLLHIPLQQPGLPLPPHWQEVSGLQLSCCPVLGEKSNRFRGWINNASKCPMPTCFLSISHKSINQRPGIRCP